MSSLPEAVDGIENLRKMYERGSAELKYDYLAAIAEAKEKYGTTNVARALGLSRHRIYQIEKEALALRDELGI